MHSAPRLTAKEWKNLRSRRLVGPKLNGAPVPCQGCSQTFVRTRGSRTLCTYCSKRDDNARQYQKRVSQAAAREAEDALTAWIKQERAEYESLDPFRRATYELNLRDAVTAQRDEEREEESRLQAWYADEETGERGRNREKRLLDETYAAGDGFRIEKPLDHALSPDGPDEGYSTYFLPKTEDGYLEAEVNWEWRTEEAAKWWRENPHAFADL